MNRFVTAVNCIDGRAQLPVIEFFKREWGNIYVDMITTPGADKVLSELKDLPETESIREKIEISINGHNSKLIAVIGHYDCLGNPVDTETHKKHIEKAAQNLKKLFPELRVLGLWLNKHWQIEVITDLNETFLSAREG